MSKSKVIFAVAILIVLMPGLGFPRSWETAMIIFFALSIMVTIVVPVSFVRKILGLHELVGDEDQATLPFSFNQKKDTEKQEKLAEEYSNQS